MLPRHRDPSVSVDSLFVSYHGKDALRGVSFTLLPGSMTGIIGPNGAGKSTLMKSLLELIPRDHGEVRILGGSVKEARTRIAYVPQRSEIDMTFPITVIDTVLLGTYPKLGLLKRPRRQHKELAYHCLEKVGMEDFGSRQIGELSGGQQQRVFLARALAQEAELFCLDEPFVGVDAASEETIVAILKELRDQNRTVLVVHHDLSKAEAYFDGLVLLNGELVKAGPSREVCRPEILSRAYAAQLTFLEKNGVGV